MLHPVLSAGKQRLAPDGSLESELTISGSDNSLFQEWVKGCSDNAVATYFKGVSSGLAERQLQHYHFKVCNGRFDTRTRTQTPTWHCTVFYGNQDAAAKDSSTLHNGPLQVHRCMSCDLACPLLLGITGEDPDSSSTPAAAAATAAGPAAGSLEPPPPPPPPSSSSSSSSSAAAAAAAAGAKPLEPSASDTPQPQQDDESNTGPVPQDPQQQQQQQLSRHIMRSCDSLVRESEHCRVWFDAKGRPMFVVTPKQHVEQLSGLPDAQLVDLFRTAVAVLDEMGCGCMCMVLNQGDNRNHAHLHLKVKVHGAEFDRAAGGWSAQHQKQLHEIRAFRDTLPAEHRGTHEAFMLRVRQRMGRGGGRDGGRQGRGRDGAYWKRQAADRR